MISSKATPRRWFNRIRIWSRNAAIGRKLAFMLAIAAVASGGATVATMTQDTPSGPADPGTILILLYLDAILLLSLGAIVARRITAVWSERRRGQAGSGLHIRLVMMFSLVAITPAILVTVFTGIFLNVGIESWFNQRVGTALGESRAVARAYLYEHQQNIRADILAVANDLDRNAHLIASNPRDFDRYLTAQASLRSLPEALVMDSRGRVLARSALSLSLEFELVPPNILAEAADGKIAVLTSGQDDRVRAVVKLNRFVDAYLLVGRFVDSAVLEHIERTEGAVSQYQRLEERREGLQITFVMMFVVVALLLLLAAVWIGLSLATSLAQPIRGLISASERVRKGDLSARVEESDATDEIGMLGRAFNRMTGQLENQQQGLMDANRQLDERRRFTETVLSGVSAGVIGLDGAGNVHLANRSASELLNADLDKSIGQPLGSVVPEIAALLKEAERHPDRVHQTEVKLLRAGQYKTLAIVFSPEKLGEDLVGYVVTFDDVTELMSAQRQAAWADVARRIAHEIKNPLTPIQLSAERLKRKYLKEIDSDPETFGSLTDTIVRQVEEIGRMVSEFSSFARMPQPIMKLENLSEICRQAVFLEENRNRAIDFTLNLPADDIFLRCDGQQIDQAFTNLLKNAAESIIDREEPEEGALPGGEIILTLAASPGEGGDKEFRVTVDDNGKGLPQGLKDRLFEPYVTTRTKGTGLGLAIVNKIVDDHNGDLLLEDREGGGARVSIVFHPTADSDADDAEEERKTPMNVATEVRAHGV